MKVMTSFDRQRKGVRSTAPVRILEACNSHGEEDGYTMDGAEDNDDNFVHPALDALMSTRGLRCWLSCAPRVSRRQAAVQEVASSDAQADVAGLSCKMAPPGTCHPAAVQI